MEEKKIFEREKKKSHNPAGKRGEKKRERPHPSPKKNKEKKKKNDGEQSQRWGGFGENQRGEPPPEKI